VRGKGAAFVLREPRSLHLGLFALDVNAEPLAPFLAPSAQGTGFASQHRHVVPGVVDRLPLLWSACVGRTPRRIIIRKLTGQTIWDVFEAERPKLLPYVGRFDGFHAVPASRATGRSKWSQSLQSSLHLGFVSALEKAPSDWGNREKCCAAREDQGFPADLKGRPRDDCDRGKTMQSEDKEGHTVKDRFGRFDGFHAVPASVSKTCLVRFDNNKYSVAASAVGRPVEVHAYAEAGLIETPGSSFSAGRSASGGSFSRRTRC
jgi:hypothetical protein